MATRINLLDWRSKQRQARRQTFLRHLAIAALATFAALLLTYEIFDHRIDNQRARNSYLTQQISELDKQIKEIQELEKVRDSLIARMRVIERLQRSRSASVHFFDEIVNTLPDGVYLTAIHQSGAAITLDGVAESNGRISTYLKNLDTSPWFKEPKLIVIRTNDKGRERNSTFTIQVTDLAKSGDTSDSARTRR